MRLGKGIGVTFTICSIVFLLLSLVNIIHAQGNWSLVRGSKWQSNLNDVFFVDSSHGWIVGSNSTILHTSDGGENWIDQPNQPLPFKVELLKVRFISPKVGWVVGENGTILKTVDGGSTWQKLTTGTFTVLQAVSFVDEKHGWLTGEGGLIMVTDNGGRSWTKQNNKDTTNNSLLSVHFDSLTEGWAVGKAGTVIHSIDGGVTWVDLKGKTASSLSSLCMLTNKVGPFH